jgi:hypothetical protein
MIPAFLTALRSRASNHQGAAEFTLKGKGEIETDFVFSNSSKVTSVIVASHPGG